MDLKLTPELQNKLINGGILFLACVISFKMFQGEERAIMKLTAQKEEEANKVMAITSTESLNKKIASYKQLINNKDVNSLFNTINSLIGDSGVKVVSLKPLRENSLPLFMEYPFQISATAQSFHTIGKFMSNLENHPNIFTVTSIVVMAPRFNSGTKEIAVDLRVSSFTLK